MRLSRNFTLEELIHTNSGLPNNPTADEAAKIADLATSLLQPIRDHWGGLYVTSGFRSAAVNKKVGGSKASQHKDGEAADFKPLEADIDKVFEWIIRKSGLHFGQCILEKVGAKQWIHISLPRKGKGNYMALKYDGKAYSPYA